MNDRKKLIDAMTADDERKTVSGLIWGDADVAEEIDITEATDRLIAYFRHSEAHTPTGHAKESDTTTGPVKTGADSLYVTPTDDEREDLAEHVEGIQYADDIAEGGDPVPEDYERHYCEEDGEDWPCAAIRRAQGEPSDAALRLAERAWMAAYRQEPRERLRAALRAAASVTEQGEGKSR